MNKSTSAQRFPMEPATTSRLGVLSWLWLLCAFALLTTAGAQLFGGTLGTFGSVVGTLGGAGLTVALAFIWRELHASLLLRLLIGAAVIVASGMAALVGQAMKEGGALKQAPSSSRASAAPAPPKPNPFDQFDAQAQPNPFDQFDPPACPSETLATKDGGCAPFYSSRNVLGNCPSGYVDHPADPSQCALPVVAKRILRSYLAPALPSVAGRAFHHSAKRDSSRAFAAIFGLSTTPPSAREL